MTRNDFSELAQYDIERSFDMIRWILILLLAGVVWSNGVKHVVIISVDGLRPDAISTKISPHIENMYRNGVSAKKAQTILPSMTLPSHTSMLTGRDVNAHGIKWNSYMAENGIVKVATCLEIARKAGLSTAMFVAKEKFKHLNRPKSLDEFSFPGNHSKDVTMAFIDYVKRKDLPNLTFIHLPDTDLAGHADGWMSPAYMKALKNIDVEVDRILKVTLSSKYKSNTVVILTADHGGLDHTHGGDIPAHRLIPWMAFGGPIKKHREIETLVTTYDTAATAIDLLKIKVPADWDGKPRLTGLWLEE